MNGVEPVDAATVILAREGQPLGRPWQCFMVRRHVRSDFAADVFVFPGGKVDEEDRSPVLAQHCSGHSGGLTPDPDPDTWRALRLAAIRELFEEAGVLLARQADGHIVDLVGAETGKFAEYRRRLQSNELSLLDLALTENLQYPLDLLHQLSRWITPEGLPRRFDTRFFVARLPANQVPIHDSRETTESLWISASEALRLHEQGEFPLVFATIKHLERLARHHSIDDLIWSLSPPDLEPVMPRMVQDSGEARFVLPGEPGY